VLLHPHYEDQDAEAMNTVNERRLGASALGRRRIRTHFITVIYRIVLGRVGRTGGDSADRHLPRTDSTGGGRPSVAR